MQHTSFESLRKAIEICLQSNNIEFYSTIYFKSSLFQLGLNIDVSSIINCRRKQEDRWFAVADLLNYASLSPENVSVYFSTKQSLYFIDFLTIVYFYLG